MRGSGARLLPRLSIAPPSRPWCKPAHRRALLAAASEPRRMTLWFVFAMMTAAAVFAVLWPLGRAPRALREGDESTVYKDQLAEIERDVAAGLIGPGEAE